MKVINTSARLICVQTKKGRIDILPGVITDNKNLDKLKDDKIFSHYLEEGILKEVKDKKTTSGGKSEKELLVEKAEGLGVDVSGLSIKKLKVAIHEAENGGGE